MKENSRKTLRYGIQYLNSHLAVKMSLIMVLAVAGLAAILQSYVQSHYIAYIEGNCVSNETAILDAVNENASSALRDLVVSGSELAVNTRLASCINLGAANSIYRFLQQCELPSAVIDAAVVGENGLIGQYDRDRSS